MPGEGCFVPLGAGRESWAVPFCAIFRHPPVHLLNQTSHIGPFIIFTGERFSSFPFSFLFIFSPASNCPLELLLRSSAPYPCAAGPGLGKPILGMEMGKTPLEPVALRPHPNFAVACRTAYFCTRMSGFGRGARWEEQSHAELQLERKRTFLERMHLFAFIYLPKAFGFIFLILPLQLRSQRWVYLS